MSDNNKSASLILIEREGPIATLVLNRPEKLNALNKAMWRDIGTEMARLSDDDAIRCVIIRGAGEKAMGPGADIAEFADQRNNSERAAAYGGLMHAAMHAIRDCRHPVVAMIKGLCVGGALELALMCDMRICQQSSRFGVPINRLGLVMAYPEIEALIGLVGPAVALEILFEARVFDADEAKDKGLVNRVVADDRLDAAVDDLARKIAAKSPVSLKVGKQAFYRQLELGLDEAYAYTSEVMTRNMLARDAEEGIDAFLEKRPPVWPGV